MRLILFLVEVIWKYTLFGSKGRLSLSMNIGWIGLFFRKANFTSVESLWFGIIKNAVLPMLDVELDSKIVLSSNSICDVFGKYSSWIESSLSLSDLSIMKKLQLIIVKIIILKKPDASLDAWQMWNILFFTKSDETM